MYLSKNCNFWWLLNSDLIGLRKIFFWPNFSELFPWKVKNARWGWTHARWEWNEHQKTKNVHLGEETFSITWIIKIKFFLKSKSRSKFFSESKYRSNVFLFWIWIQIWICFFKHRSKSNFFLSLDQDLSFYDQVGSRARSKFFLSVDLNFYLIF